MNLFIQAGNSTSFNPQHVQAAVASIVGRMGCTRCGLVATLPVEYQADPSPASSGQGMVC
ncbi:MAG TPA: hypothetical protein VF472_25950 [Burkholderiaceae bacterium]